MCFFQAEDGIRYWSVAGVQTCALPIFVEENNLAQNISMLRRVLGEGGGGGSLIETVPRRGRSEERRVGKSVDLGGRRIIKKKKRTRSSHRCSSAKNSSSTRCMACRCTS